jgi:DNA-binding response OmpR family regulator
MNWPNRGGVNGRRVALKRSGPNGNGNLLCCPKATETVDCVGNLETGADGYIAKPFEPRELLAHVKSMLRRATAAWYIVKVLAD